MQSDSTIHDDYQAVSELLDSLRQRIRAYVWIETILMALVLVGVVFWGGLVLDWLLEPSPQVRMVAHLLLVSAILVIIAWWGIRRWMTVLSDRSLALLIERKHPELEDALSSAVDLQSDLGTERVHPELAARTIRSAAESARQLGTDDLLNQLRLNRFALTVGGLAISVIGLALGVPRVWDTYTQRLALSPEDWPRTVSLSIDGFQPDGQGGFIRRVARNSDVPIVVRAALDTELRAPDRVTIRYRWQEGRKGRDDLVRIGNAQPGRDEQQRYEYLFERIASDVEFEIRGGDDRLKRLRLEVVERPKVTSLQFDCQYPEYLDRSQRSIPVGPRVELPEGTRLVAIGEANKPLEQVQWRIVKQSSEAPVVDTDTTEDFRAELEVGRDDLDVEITLLDRDGISSAEPFRITVAARRDEKPQVLAARQGIGTAVTANAQLPIQVTVEDDYGVDSAELTWKHDKESMPPIAVPLPPVRQGEAVALATIDLAELAGKHAEEPRYSFAPGQQLSLVAIAKDRYDLTDEPRDSSARTLSVEIVTEEELMSRLAASEQNLRQTFESIADKLLLLYDSLEKLGVPAASAMEVIDSSSAPPEAPDTFDRELEEGRLARESGRLTETARQIGAEVLGVAAGFENIHAQLFNNRIENSELSDRIGNRIAAPLRSLGEQRMQSVAQRIAKLAAEGLLDEAMNETREAIAEVEELLREMQGLENYNEVIAMLREIIRQQDQINTKTKKEQKSNLRDLLLD